VEVVVLACWRFAYTSDQRGDDEFVVPAAKDACDIFEEVGMRALKRRDLDPVDEVVVIVGRDALVSSRVDEDTEEDGVFNRADDAWGLDGELDAVALHEEERTLGAA
jgi:hypothetical protein